MSFARVYSVQASLLNSSIINIEVDLSKGLHSFNIVGLPDKAVEEAKDRVGAAIKNSGFKSPKNKNQKIVISLAPADLKKEGPSFDLPIALSYLLSSGDIKFKIDNKLFLGELSLDGKLRPIKGALPLTQKAQKGGFEEIYLPKENAKEAALIKGIKIFGVQTLKELIDHLNIKKDFLLEPQGETAIEQKEEKFVIDFSEIKGQETAKRGLEIAAAGGHNIAMYGPPGTGKTMLARAFAHILPPLTYDEILETTSIHSVAGLLEQDLITTPPFRSPHHTASYVSLVGGGTFPKPGEVTLAHRGVLFLDEFPEFEKKVIEALRQPLEDSIVNISRARGSARFPANFIMIAAMNPCPCGNYGVTNKICNCRPNDLMRYKRKLSGPIVDRIDMWVPVYQVDYQKLSSNKESGVMNTEEITKKVIRAREIQNQRFKNHRDKIRNNSEMGAKDLNKFVYLSDELKNILNQSAKKLDLSARAYHRIIKLARTIADLDNDEHVLKKHIFEALQYRPRQEKY